MQTQNKIVLKDVIESAFSILLILIKMFQPNPYLQYTSCLSWARAAGREVVVLECDNYKYYRKPDTKQELKHRG